MIIKCFFFLLFYKLVQHSRTCKKYQHLQFVKTWWTYYRNDP